MKCRWIAAGDDCCWDVGYYAARKRRLPASMREMLDCKTGMQSVAGGILMCRVGEQPDSVMDLLHAGIKQIVIDQETIDRV